jgi:predicted Rossmann fold flavoprotein
MGTRSYDVVVAGAGAAGMMAAWEAAKRGRRVLVADHARKPGEKIRISGGGRCNFTNLHCSPDAFLSENPHFCRSALSRYTQWDFLDLIQGAGIAYHEKTLGQLFCDGSARQVVDLLVDGMTEAGAELRLGAAVSVPERTAGGFSLAVGGEAVACKSVVVATGGKSIPKMGASGWGYDVARRFGLCVTETRPALVPLTLDEPSKARFAGLVGVAVPARASHGGASFDEAVLFTHRGLSGPAVLQLSSYWREGEAVSLDLSPGTPVLDALLAAKATNGRQTVRTALAQVVPKSLAATLTPDLSGPIAEASRETLAGVAARVHAFTLTPAGSEGYRTAEVTLGGVSTDDLDQKTMAARAVPELHFVGEVVDVTGWLGGYNFQWAWSSGWAAGQFA